MNSFCIPSAFFIEHSQWLLAVLVIIRFYKTCQVLLRLPGCIKFLSMFIYFSPCILFKSSKSTLPQNTTTKPCFNLLLLSRFFFDNALLIFIVFTCCTGYFCFEIFSIFVYFSKFLQLILNLSRLVSTERSYILKATLMQTWKFHYMFGFT